jgi:hypothetical protein
MAASLTAENVVRRIAAEGAYVNERGGVASGSNRQLQSCGGTESNSERGGDTPVSARESASPALSYQWHLDSFWS